MRLITRVICYGISIFKIRIQNKINFFFIIISLPPGQTEPVYITTRQDKIKQTKIFVTCYNTIECIIT